MPRSRGLFSAAILESHGCDEYGFPLAYGEANTGGNIVAKSTCAGAADPLACLRALPAHDLWALVNELDPRSTIIAYHYFQPVWDGVVIPQPPKLLLERGEFAPVPLLLGTNVWEIIVWLYQGPPFARYNYTWANVTENILWYGNNNQTVVDYYRAHYGSPDIAFIESLTAQRFACGTRRIATAYARAGLNAWLYLFDYLQAGDVREWLGHAGHSAELNSVFNHSGSHVVEEDYRMSAEMQNLWLRFVLNHNPSYASNVFDPPYEAVYRTAAHPNPLPHWPPFDLTGESVLYVRNENLTSSGYHFNVTQGYYDEVCDGYWTPNVDATPVQPRYQVNVSSSSSAAPAPSSSSSSTSAPAPSSSPSTATSSTALPPVSPTSATSVPSFITSSSSSSSSSSGAGDVAAATCDVWCIVAIVMIVLLSIGFIASLYRLYHSNSRAAPPKPPQAVPAATPRQRSTRPKRVRPPVESVNTSGHYAPVTPVLQANPYEGGLNVPVLQANPYEGSLAPAPGQSHVVDVGPEVSAGGDVWRPQGGVGESPMSGGGVKRKKKVKRAIRIDTGEGGRGAAHRCPAAATAQAGAGQASGASGVRRSGGARGGAGQAEVAGWKGGGEGGRC